MNRRVRIAFLAVGMAVAVAAVLATLRYRQFLNQPLGNREAEIYVLQAGTSYAGMVADLEARGWTDSPWAWRLLGHLGGQASRLQAGEYRLEPGTTPPRWLDRLVRGEVILHRFTIVEGWTAAEMIGRLLRHPAVTVEPGFDPEALAETLDIGHPEGWFLPETYRFPRGTGVNEILHRAHRAMRQALAEAWDSRDLGLPLDTPYEVLILASIVEKETGLAEERAKIAGVFVRRLRASMRLQTDPTVIYGLGEAFDGDLRRRDLRGDTPYNTYTRHGLPPTPIALPGRAALAAATRPEEGSALYFVARGDGSHQFSDTLAEHEQAVDRYQRNRPGTP